MAGEMARSESVTTYIGTYTRRESFVDGKAEGIYIYRLNSATGELTYADTVAGPGTVNPSFLVLGPDNRFLYAVNELYSSESSHGDLSAFAVDPETKSLRYLNQQSTHGLAPCFAAVDPEGRYCLVANYETGNLCVLPVQSDGSLGEATDLVQFSGHGPNTARQEGPHAHMVVPSPNNRFIHAIDLGADRIMTFRLDMERGALTPADPPWAELPPGTGPRHLAFHPLRSFVYVISELHSTITVFQYDEQLGTFASTQIISTVPDSYTGDNLGAEIQVAPNGRFVYASNRGDDSIVVFAVDQETGHLSFVERESSQGIGPRTFVIDPTGTLLLVANQDSDTVVTFWIDQASGTLKSTGHVASVPTPVCLQLVNS